MEQVRSGICEIGVLLQDTVHSYYHNMVQYNMIFYTTLQWLSKNTAESLNSQQISHTLPSKASYCMSIKNNFEEIDR